MTGRTPRTSSRSYDPTTGADDSGGNGSYFCTGATARIQYTDLPCGAGGISPQMRYFWRGNFFQPVLLALVSPHSLQNFAYAPNVIRDARTLVGGALAASCESGRRHPPIRALDQRLLQKFENRCAAIMLWWGSYNFCRIRRTLGMAPLMPAGCKSSAPVRIIRMRVNENGPFSST